MRHWKPYIRETLAQMIADGYQSGIAFCMAPHASRLSSEAYLKKLREAQDPFPPKKRTEGQRLLRLCLWMLAGLLPAGMLTLALWPIVSRRALRLAHSHPDAPIEARRALLALRLALALGVVAVVLAGLLLLHWLG
jgi:hypothetical protein